MSEWNRQGLALRQHQPFAFSDRYRITKLPRGLDPQADRLLDVLKSGYAGISVGATAW